ncbi:unnamed protein product [Schistocephalus solidus]|uniref:Uncharacterized protein n=1 Tax=Schistocephalus solidus TaxID=70667 RepID=A0A183SRC5_SCHSO|nr:unnamed protein product [Schistocephalus solidus]
MASRTALISILVLVSADLLSRAYPKEEFKEALKVEDVLLEDALSETDIPESAVEIDEKNLRPTVASRTALISILVLVSVVLLSRAYPKEEFKEALNVEDVLLEDALSETDIPESAVGIDEKDLRALRPAGLRRRWRRLRERIRSAARRIKRGLRRAWDRAKPYVPLILNNVFRVPVP